MLEVIRGGRTDMDGPTRTFAYADLLCRPPADIQWVVDRLAPLGGTTMLTGDAGLGKTWAALALAHAVAGNRLWLEEFPVSPGPVLFYDGESGEDLLRHRLHALRAGCPDLPVDLPIVFRIDTGLQIDQPSGITEVQMDLERYVPRLVVCDSLRALFGGDENASGDVRPPMRDLKTLAGEFGCAFLLLHHTRKMGHYSNAASQMPRGSSDLRAAVDSHLFMSLQPQGRLRIEQEKSRWAPPARPFGIEIMEVDGGGVRLRYAPEDEPQVGRLDRAKRIVLAHLDAGTGPIARPSLIDQARAQGVSRRTVERALQDLEETREVACVGHEGRRALYGRAER